MLKLIIVAVVSILGSAGATYFLVKPAASAETEAAAIEEEPELDLVEVPIDTFNVSNRVAAPGAVIHIRFKLVAGIPKGQDINFDEAINKTMPARIREAVVGVARSCGMDDIQDPELNVVKRQIKEKINKVLRQSMVTEIFVSDFRTMEQ